MQNIRNFCIIAHIDHGKSTLADRFLELTATVEKRKMQEQYLDQMDLERERGITIKLQPVKMRYRYNDEDFILNLIDTPGHVDFSYEVSRSLAAVEGAILLVDATKGVQAQTLANLHLAQQSRFVRNDNSDDKSRILDSESSKSGQKLKIIPVINKIDMVNARTDQVIEELAHLLTIEPEKILCISAKDGTNVKTVLEKIITDVPAPAKDGGELKALIFDSTFDAYKGVIAFVRIFNGKVKGSDKMIAFATGAKAEVLEVGYFSPKLTVGEELQSGEIGYIATGFKDTGFIRVGDTITNQQPSSSFFPLDGYKEARPMVFGSFFPENSDDYDNLKDALGKLKLTDAALTYEPESSAGLGRGFRLGFLGMLHVEIISERLLREFGLPLIISSPSVEYTIRLKNGSEVKIRSAALLPDVSRIENISEPIVAVEIIAPSSYMGSVMDLMTHFRNRYVATDYLGKDTVVLKYTMPLAEIIIDFYDKLKSVSSGYASMSYEPIGSEINDLVRLDILVADEIVEPFSRIVPREKAYYEGRVMVDKLKDIIPAQWFQVALQAVIGGKIIARESIRARSKDVTQHMYGGDITRKMKLREKQKRGKKKMEELGKVNIPQEVFLKMLKR